MWVEVAGGRLWAQSRGGGEPLVLVHGWPFDHRLFRPQLDALAGELQVIAFDRRGFGRSDAPPDLRLEIDDIDRILDAFGLASAHLLGMSQGGRIVLRYASRRPGRLRSLILQGAVVDGLVVNESAAERVPVAEYAALARQGRIASIRERWLAHPMMRLPPECPEALALVEEILAGYGGRDLETWTPDAYAFDGDVLGAMRHLEVPTLILTGAHETRTRRLHAQALLERIPDCREVILEASGHLSNLTEPATWNAAVLAFVSAVTARGGGTAD